MNCREKGRCSCMAWVWYMKLIKKLDGLFIKFKNNTVRYLSENNEGMGVVEVLLIILVLVGLVLIFKNQITTIVNNIFRGE